MSFDLSKLPTKTAVAVSFVIGLLLLGAAGVATWLSYSSNQPFMIYGKEFGFGSSELQRKTTQLSDCQAESGEIKAQLSEALKEVAQMKELISKRANHDAAMWFPVDDVLFDNSGAFSTESGRRSGHGRWSDPDSELAFRLLTMEPYREVTLETNLPPPGNKVRLDRPDSILVPMNTWEYRLSLLEVYPGQARIRVERRPKAQY